jgi:hypothetical protein
MDIILCVTPSEKNRIRKTIQSQRTYSGTLREQSNVVHPSILIEIDNPTLFNYLYIPSWNRYYFISEMTSVKNDLWRIDCTCDALMSFANAILGLDVMPIASGVDGQNQYLDGPQWSTLVKDTTSTINFSSGLNASGEYVLITSGG